MSTLSSRGHRTRSVLVSQAQAGLTALAQLRSHPVPRPNGPIVVTGSGSSYYLSLSAAFAAAACGQDARAVPACEILLYPDVYLRAGVTLVAVSRSGKTSEVLEGEALARRRGLRTIAVTCSAESPLAMAAADRLISPHGEDGTLVMLRSFSSMLLMIDAWLLGPEADHALKAAAEQLDVWAGTALAATATLVESLPEHLVVLGGGPFYGIARETALKAEEMALIRPEAYHPLEYRHGPRATVGDRDLVLLYADPRHAAVERPLLDELSLQGARTAVVSTEAAAWAGSQGVILPLPALESANVDVLGTVAVVVGQALAWNWAIRRGVDPDTPPKLTDVVVLPARR